MTLLTVSCSKEETFTSQAGEGCLQMKVALNSQTRAYEPLETSTLRIYNGEGGLIRKYKPVSEMPNNLYLVAGNYKAVVEAGDQSAATWTNKSYYGEKEFTIEPQQTTSIEVLCKLTNSAVKVVYDASVSEKFDTGVVTYVSARDIFSKTEAENTSAPTLKYTENNLQGYFLLPEDVSKLSWGFYGTLKDGTAVELTSTANNREITPEAGKLYTLNFKFSNTPGGNLQLTVKVDEEDLEEHNDSFLFSPEPTISGNGFSMGNVVAYAGSDLQFTVASVNKLKNLTLSLGGNEYAVLTDGTAADLDAAGIRYVATDEYNGTVSLSDAFFAGLDGGIKSISFLATDDNAGEGKATAQVAVQGLMDAEYNLWNNTATLKAIITDPSVSAATIKYRKQGDAEWKNLPATPSENYTYVATVAPTWSEGTNANNHTIYTLTEGILANNDYEYQLMVSGAEEGVAKSFSTTTSQVIPYGDMEDSSLSCFTQSNTSAPYWGSGNNSFTKTLCTQNTFTNMGGSHCAKLQATSTLGILAAGNLFLGTFTRQGTGGHVDFGLKYDWQARPTAMKVKLHATIGTVTSNTHNGPLAVGSQDIGQIFVAIIDWNSRHVVTSGTSGASGVWSPANGPDAVSEGKIIGYGLHEVTSTEGDAMIELTIPIAYYDTVTKPSGNYTLTIACATSAYGDYMNGNDSNTMYVDDFEWVY